MFIALLVSDNPLPVWQGIVGRQASGLYET